MSQPTAEKGPFVLILLPRGSPPAWRELADEISGWVEADREYPDGIALVVEVAADRASSRRELQRATRPILETEGTAELVLVLGEDWLPLRAAAAVGRMRVPCLCVPLVRQDAAPPVQAAPPETSPPSGDGSLAALLCRRALGSPERLEPNIGAEACARLILDRTRRATQVPARPEPSADEDWLFLAEEVFEAQRRLLDWGQDLVQHRRDLETKGWLAPRLGRARRRVRRFLRKRGWV